MSASDAVTCVVLCQSVRTQNECLSSFLSPFRDSDNEIFSLFADLDIAVLPANFSFLSFSCISSFPTSPPPPALFTFIEQTVTTPKKTGIE